MKKKNPIMHAAFHEDETDFLNDRQKAVLREVCESFISTGVPVGSRTLSKSGKISCSPATIRNEMADLETLGYIYSPHISAGRIPTEKGYKFYVEFLIDFQRLSLLEETIIDNIADAFKRKHSRQQDILKSAIKYACEQTALPGILLTPQTSTASLKSIKIVRVLEDKAMLITVDERGNITDQIVAIPAATEDEILNKISILMNAQLCHSKHQRYEQNFINSTRHLLSQYNTLLSTLVNKVKTSIKDPDVDTLFFEGFVNFFNQPEFCETEKMKQLISLLDQKEAILNLLAKSLESENDIVVNIGSDTGLAIKDMSFVTARYKGPDESYGKIGLIGPLRMNYTCVVSILLKLTHALNQALIGDNNLNFNSSEI